MLSTPAESSPPEYIKFNRFASKVTRIKNLEFFVKSAYSIPGTDSSRHLRLKKIDDCGPFGATLDIIMRSLVNFFIISFFEQDTKTLASGIVSLINKNIQESPEMLNSLRMWCNSSAGKEDFTKYIRDKRSDILKNWVQQLTLKPYAIVFTSLAKFLPLWKKNSKVLNAESQVISIFGITG